MPALKQLKPNPFKPTAGMTPPEIIGRHPIVDDFDRALTNGPGAPDRLMRISGTRGVGKTVMLNVLEQKAREHGMHVVSVSGNSGFCSRITAKLAGAFTLSSATLEPELFGAKIGSLELSGTQVELGRAMASAAKKKGLFVTIDEVQDAPIDEMRALGNEIQLLIREGLDVAFAFAGLPSATDGLVREQALTFLQRAKHIELSRLNGFDVFDSFADTIARAGKSASKEATTLMTSASAGYPFLVQLVGYNVWDMADRRGSDVIEQDDAERGIETARRAFGSMVIEPALNGLPKRQVEYLLAMASCGDTVVQTAAIAQAMSEAPEAVATFRTRLIKASIIEKKGYGRVAFAIPYMREYLLDRAEDIREDFGIA